MIKLARKDYILIGLLALVYYLILCSKQWTWIFVSGDSGDWLASSIWWMNSQPFGSPLYILAGHFLNLFPHDLVMKMTVFLSVIPASITVATTYLIAKKLTGNIRYSIVSALVLMGSAVFLSQSTILEEYALTTMFLTLALYHYVNHNSKRTILYLGLGTAVHVIIGVICLVWLAVHNKKEIKLWAKLSPIYILVGILPYILVPILMYLPTPKLLAGGLSLESFNSYLGSSGTVGSISWYDFIINRVPQIIGVFCVSLGLALIPLFKAIKRPFTRAMSMMVWTIAFSVWLYVTNTDPSTWTFLCFSFPMMAILVAIGLQKMKPYHANMVAYSAIMLILLNGILLNADLLTKEAPMAQTLDYYMNKIQDGSYVVESSGGGYGLGTIYIMAKGKDVIPIYYSGKEPSSENYKTDERYQCYIKWLDETYGVKGKNTLEQVRYLLDKGKRVFILMPTVTPFWVDYFTIVKSEDNPILWRVYDVRLSE